MFFTALQFYTRFPCPAWIGYSDNNLNRSTRYFPLMGWIIGSLVAAVSWAASLVLPLPVAVILGVATGVLATGAFHEDGFADLCDGFGGGVTRERTLEIMKDSRVGAYAAIGLVLLFALKLTTLTALLGADLWRGLVGLVFAHVLSRWCVVTMIFTHEYARADATSKIKPIGRHISIGGLIAATVWLLPFGALLIANPWAALAVIPAYGAKVILGRWFTRRLGGYTGDCLGATQQIIEVIVLLWFLGVAQAAL